MRLITRNPEFNRNLWIEFSGQRAVVVPILFGLLLWLLFSLPDPPDTLGPVIEGAMLVIAGAALWLGGPYQIAQGLFTEWERHTWDIQRLSPITPWRLVWGKLFGSTVFVWYIGLCALLLYLVLPGWFGKHQPLPERWLMGALFLSTAVMLQACAFLSTLYSLRYGALFARNVKRPSVTVAAFALLGVPPMLRLFTQSGEILWYDNSYMPRVFLLGSSAVLSLWGVYGCYRITRSDFLYRNGPLPWLLFTVFLAVWLAGLSQDAPVYTALTVSLVLLYVTLFSAPVDTLGLHHTLAFMRSGQWRRVGETLPLWTNTLPVVVVLLVYAMLASPQGILPRSAVMQSAVGKLLTPGFYLSLTGFVARDICLLHLLYFSQRNQRAMGACFVYLAVLYVLIPSIMKTLDVQQLLGLFLPLPGQSLPLVWIEVLALGIWARQRWETYAAVAFAAPE
ncbi:MAG TPA: hypothetical protein PLF22_09750 [Pseudomonadales bacterium]|nr:hypothetical protein [Pseudomonadales bacterium]